MQKLVLILLSVLSAGVFAQPDTLWTRTYGGADSDGASSVQQTADGGFIVCATTESFRMGGTNCWLIRTDSNGDTLWTKIIGSNKEQEWANALDQTNDGGFIVAGYTRYAAESRNIFLLRTDTHGDSLWLKEFGGNLDEECYSVKHTVDGGFILAGQTRSFGAGNEDIWIIKTNSNGDTLWTKTYGDSLDERYPSILQTTDGGYIIAGRTNSFRPGMTDVWIIRTDSNGDSLWTKRIGGTGHYRAYDIQQTTDGGFIITGDAYSVATGADYLVIRTNADGDSLWTKTFGGDLHDYGYSVQQTHDGGFIVVGYAQSFKNKRSPPSNLWIIKMNADGDSLWTKAFGGIEIDYGVSIQETTDKGYIIAGVTVSYGNGNSDVWLIRLAPDTSTTTLKPNKPQLPNKFSLTCTIINNTTQIEYHLPHTSLVDISIYNTFGQEVTSLVEGYKNAGRHITNWNNGSSSPGIYHVRFSTGKKTLIQKILITK